MKIEEKKITFTFILKNSKQTLFYVILKLKYNTILYSNKLSNWDENFTIKLGKSYLEFNQSFQPSMNIKKALQEMNSLSLSSKNNLILRNTLSSCVKTWNQCGLLVELHLGAGSNEKLRRFRSHIFFVPWFTTTTIIKCPINNYFLN